jgi:molybdopterin synthase sulfur carrier subunit
VVIVRFFAGARAAAGTPEAKVDAATLADLVQLLTADHGEPLARVLAVSSFLVDGQVNHDRAEALPDGAAVDVLPPFAGG